MTRKLVTSARLPGNTGSGKNGTSILIIGAGIAGLTAGCYAQMNGYQTEICEMHDKPGGLCTSWKRGCYLFDGCVQWLTGSALGGGLDGFYRIWQELGAIQGRAFVNHEEFMHIRGPQGKTLILYTNADRLEQHLKELAPEDSALIHRLTGAIRRLARYRPPLGKPPELRHAWDKAGMLWGTLPYLDIFRDFGTVTIRDFAQRFQNPLLRQLFPLLFFEMDDFPVFAVLFTLAGLHAHQCGYPVGGSLALARDIERRYQDLGGQVHYRARVEKVLIEDGRAAGVRLADGSERRADRIVSAADGHWTIFDLLDGRYISESIQEYYRHAPIYPPMVLISIGVRRDLSDQPHAVYYPLSQPFTLGGKTEHWLGIRHYGFDPHMAPAGKAVMVIEFFSDYEYWRELSTDRKRYAEEKQRIADWIVGELEARFAGITEQIEVIDIATPVTFNRYTGLWKGAFMGWKMAAGLPHASKPKTLPGLSRFYMTGQWVEPTGGLPSVIKSGRDLVQLLCAEDRRRFQTTLPAG